MDAPNVSVLKRATLNNSLVFVVDDQPDLADLIATFLRSCGFAVLSFSSPVTALAAATSQKPDLLLSDFRMPEMDGLTLAMKMMACHPSCRVLMMSGVAHQAMSHPASNRFEFLDKPVSLDVVLTKVKATLSS